MTEQELTQKILRDTNRQAKALITAAETQAEAKIVTAEQNAAQRKITAIQKGQDDLNYRQLQQSHIYEVANIRAQINAQQAQIEQAFTQAREKLLHATPEDIRKFVDLYQQKYAKAGDKILVAKAWSHAVPQLPITTTIEAGIIIENDSYRYELDIDSILQELRGSLTPEIAKILGVI